MAYELKQSDIFGFATFINGETKTKGEELFFKYCPYCGGGHSRDKETFSINLGTGAFKCFRSTCGRQGHFVQAARDFGYKLDFTYTNEKRYRQLPQHKKIEVRDSAIDYMASRGISEQTCRQYSITSRKNENDILVLPFYDEFGNLVTVKYRNTKFIKGKSSGGKEWFEKNTKPILYGMDKAIDFEKPLIITEGQMDSLSLAECGIPNAVSVPNGSNGMTWVTHCYDWVCKFPEIIVFGDYENGKVTLVEAIYQKFPKKIIRCVRPDDYLMEKDANDILRKYGKDALKQAIERSEPIALDRVTMLSEVESVDIYAKEHFFSGIYKLDEILNGFYVGSLIILSGKSGNGKSTVMSQLIVEALEQDVKTFIYTGELTDYHFRRWLDLQIAGDDYVVENKGVFGEVTYTISDSVAKGIGEWYRGKAWIYNESISYGKQGGKSETDILLDTIEMAIQRYGIKFICIDNLMTALDVPISENLYSAQTDFVKKLKEIAQTYCVTVLLVAHPRKNSSSTIEKDDISGSSNITNYAHVVLTYSRDAQDDTLGYIAVKKNRLTGYLTKPDNEIRVRYSKKSKRICGEGFKPNRVYSWVDKAEPDENGDLPF